MKILWHHSSSPNNKDRVTSYRWQPCVGLCYISTEKIGRLPVFRTGMVYLSIPFLQPTCKELISLVMKNSFHTSCAESVNITKQKTLQKHSESLTLCDSCLFVPTESCWFASEEKWPDFIYLFIYSHIYFPPILTMWASGQLTIH